MQVDIVFFTASRAIGMYDSEYHVSASDWMITNSSASPALWYCESYKKERSSSLAWVFYSKFETLNHLWLQMFEFDI